MWYTVIGVIPFKAVNVAKQPAKLNKPPNFRRIRSGKVNLDEILFNPQNWRIHPDSQQQALAGTIDSIGYLDPIEINLKTGHLMDGHARVALAARSGWKEIDADYYDLTEEEERQYLLSKDTIAAMAASDRQKVDELLHLVQSDDERVQQMMAEIAEREGLYQDENAGRDAEPQINKADELREKWQTETGQLWQLGDHRIICGDCTDRAVVDRVMGGEKADMVLTDPPYALFGNSTGVSGIADDKMVRPFFRDIAKISIDFTNPFSHVYVCCDWHSAFVIQDVMQSTGLTAKNLCIWDKGDGGIGANYQICYEMIWFFSNSPKAQGTLARKATGERTVNGVPNIWRFPRASSDRHHNAEKPIELFSVPLSHGSKDGEIVIDFFLGGGTTLIACENLHRKCRGIEISPAYIAVTLQRWHDLTGKMPELIT